VTGGAEPACSGLSPNSSPREAPTVEYATAKGEMSLDNRIAELEVALTGKRWIIPSAGGVARDRETAVLVRQMRHFTRSDHPLDRLVALCLATWGIASAGRREAKWVPLPLLDLTRR